MVSLCWPALALVLVVVCAPSTYAGPSGFCDDVAVFCGAPNSPTGNCTNSFDCNCLSGYDHNPIYPGNCLVSTSEECTDPISVYETSLGTTAAIGFNPVEDSVQLTNAGRNIAVSIRNEAVQSRSGFDVSWTSSLLSPNRAACNVHSMSSFLSGTTQSLALGCLEHGNKATCDSVQGCAWDASLGACATAYSYHKRTLTDASQVVFSCDAGSGSVLTDTNQPSQSALLIDSSQEGRPRAPGGHFVCEGTAADATNRLYCPSPTACPLSQKVTAPTPTGWRWSCPQNPVCPPPPMPGFTNPWTVDLSTQYTFYSCPAGGINLNPAVYYPDSGDPCSQPVACATGSNCPLGWFCDAAGAETPACPPMGPAWLVASKKRSAAHAASVEAAARHESETQGTREQRTYYCDQGASVRVAHPEYYTNLGVVTGPDGTYKCRGDEVQGEFECSSATACPVHVGADGTRTQLTCTANMPSGTEICPPRSTQYVNLDAIDQTGADDVVVTVPVLDDGDVATPYAFERTSGGFGEASRTCAGQCGGSCPFGASDVTFSVAADTVVSWTGGLNGGESVNGPFVVHLDGPSAAQDVYVTLDEQLKVLGVYQPGTPAPASLAELRANPRVCTGGSFDEDTLTFTLNECSNGPHVPCSGLKLRGPNPSGLNGRYQYQDPVGGALTTCTDACNTGAACLGFSSKRSQPEQGPTKHDTRLLGDGSNVYCRGAVASATQYRVNCYTSSEAIDSHAGADPAVGGLDNTVLSFLVDANSGSYVASSLTAATLDAKSFATPGGTVTVTRGSSTLLTVPIRDTTEAVCNANAGITLLRTLQQARAEPSVRRRQRRRVDLPTVYTCANAPTSALFHSNAVSTYLSAVFPASTFNNGPVGLYFPPADGGSTQSYAAPVAPRQFLTGSSRLGTSLALNVYPCTRGPVYCLGNSADGWTIDGVVDPDELVCPPATAVLSGGSLSASPVPAAGDAYAGWVSEVTCWDQVDVDIPFVGAVSTDCCQRDVVECSNNGATSTCARYSCTPRVCALDLLPEAAGLPGLSSTRSVCQDLPLQVLYTISFTDASVTFSADIESAAECFLVQMLFDDVEQRMVVVVECRVANPFRMDEPFTSVHSVDDSESTKLLNQVPQGLPNLVAPAGTYSRGHTNTFGNTLPTYDEPPGVPGTTTYSYATTNCPTNLDAEPEERCIHTTTIFFNSPPAGWGVHCTTNRFDGSSNEESAWVLTWGGDFVCKDTLEPPSEALPCGGVTVQPAPAQLSVSAVNVDFCAETVQVQFTVDITIHDIPTGLVVQEDLTQNENYLARLRVVPIAGQERATTFLSTSNITRIVLEGDIVAGFPGYELVLMDTGALVEPQAPVSTSVRSLLSRVEQEIVNDVITSVLYMEFEFTVSPSTFFLSTSQPGPGILYRFLVSGDVHHIASSGVTRRRRIVVTHQSGKREDVIVDPVVQQESVTVSIGGGTTSGGTDGVTTDGGDGGSGSLTGMEVGLIVAGVVAAAIGASMVVIGAAYRRRSVGSEWAKTSVII